MFHTQCNKVSYKMYCKCSNQVDDARMWHGSVVTHVIHGCNHKIHYIYHVRRIYNYLLILETLVPRL